ncbi:MAG: PP2C family protein-serine/threonine phosphatase [Planctomycetota bacterium]
MKEPQEIELPPALREDLYEADALPEIAVLFDPALEVLEAYGLEPGVGVIAVVRGGADARREALERGALEAFSPDVDEDEARVRLAAAVARFRSRLELERDREHLAAQQAALERNLRLAARLQRGFLPRAVPTLPQVRFSTAYLPQEFVSGDSYEVRLLDGRHVAIYTLDAVGHGVRAALLTVLLRAHWNPTDGAGRPRPPGEVLGELNRALLDARLDDSPTAAFCYGLLDVETGAMRVASGGHPPPVVLRPDGTQSALACAGLLLGVDDLPYEEHEVVLEPGERVFFFTDGADTGYDERFARQLALHADLNLEDQVGGALGAVIQLDQEGRPEDDVTVVALQFLGTAAPVSAGTRE